MKPVEAAKYALAGVIVLAIVALLVTQLMGQPFMIFVETGSMEPTLLPNDGYLAVPAFIAGPPEEGDVILFKSQELGGGELTTHRVVRQTPQGYITKGDANPFTDQAGGEPPVSTGQIRAVGLEFGGELVVIPGLGATVGGITGSMKTVIGFAFGFVGLEAPGVSAVSMGVLVIGLLVFIYSTATGSLDKHARERSRGSLLRNGVVIIAILTLVVIIPVNFSMLLPSGVYQIEIVSAVEPTENERIIGAGESGNVTYFVRNGGHLPVMVFLEPASPGVETPDGYTYVPRRTQINKTVVMHAPNQTGSYLRFVREWRYLVVLPPSLIAMAHAIHPLIAILLINATVASVVILISLATVGTGRLRLRSRSRDVPLELTIRRMLPPLPLIGSRRDRGRAPPSPPANASSPTPPPPDPPTGEPDTTLPDPSETGFDTRTDVELPDDTQLSNVEPSAHSPDSEEAESAPADESQIDEPSVDSGAPGEFEWFGDDPNHEMGQAGSEASGKLDGGQLIEVYAILQEPPTVAGLDGDTWTVELLQKHLDETYGVDYDREACELLLDQAGADT